MNKQNFIIRYFWHEEAPQTIFQCFVVGSINFALALLFGLISYHVTSMFVSEPAAPFPWQLMSFLFPFTFLSPFFMWWKNKAA